MSPLLARASPEREMRAPTSTRSALERVAFRQHAHAVVEAQSEGESAGRFAPRRERDQRPTRRIWRKRTRIRFRRARPGSALRSPPSPAARVLFRRPLAPPLVPPIPSPPVCAQSAPPACGPARSRPRRSRGGCPTSLSQAPDARPAGRRIPRATTTSHVGARSRARVPGAGRGFPGSGTRATALPPPRNPRGCPDGHRRAGAPRREPAARGDSVRAPRRRDRGAASSRRRGDSHATAASSDSRSAFDSSGTPSAGASSRECHAPR